MVSELNKNAEFGEKNKDEEDPILVAQRFLNIFHQLHIFNQKRRDEFDQSLLALSSDIRILLSTLPGGSVLLDHIAELEEEKGVALVLQNKEKNKDIAKPKTKLSKSLQNNAPDEENTPENILKVLRQSQEKQEKEIRALTAALVESQNNMAYILKEIVEAKKTDEEVKPTPEENSETFIENKDVSTSSKEDAQSQKETLKDDGVISEETNESEKEVDTHKKNETKTKEGRLFGLGKIFSSLKDKNAAADKRNIDNSLDMIGDETPISLDDVSDAPVSLESEDASDSVQQEVSEENDQEISSDVAEKDILQPEDQENSSDNNDWTWEYIDETDDATDDSEWEYIEIPEDEQTSEDTKDESLKDTSKPSPVVEDAKSSDNTEDTSLLSRQTGEGGDAPVSGYDAVSLQNQYPSENDSYQDQYRDGQYFSDDAVYQDSYSYQEGQYAPENSFDQKQLQNGQYFVYDDASNNDLMDRFMQADVSENNNYDPSSLLTEQEDEKK